LEIEGGIGLLDYYGVHTWHLLLEPEILVSTSMQREIAPESGVIVSIIRRLVAKEFAEDRGIHHSVGLHEKN
jgi:hypothetical protein